MGTAENQALEATEAQQLLEELQRLRLCARG